MNSSLTVEASNFFKIELRSNAFSYAIHFKSYSVQLFAAPLVNLCYQPDPGICIQFDFF